MFTSQIEELEQQLKQLRNEADEKERELYELRIAEEYVYEAGSKVEETIAGLEDKYIETFKNYLLSLFERGTTGDLEPEEYLETVVERGFEGVKLEKTTERENSFIPVLNDEAIVVGIQADPSTMQVIRPGIVYSSCDRTAYIGGRSKNRLIGFGIAFVDRGLAKDFRVESPPTVREIESKHQLKLIEISLNNIKYIAELNLSKDCDDPNNKTLLSEWLTLGDSFANGSVKNGESLENEKILPGDIVQREKIGCEYEVIVNGSDWIGIKCIKHTNEEMIGRFHTFKKKEVQIIRKAVVA
ncbi:MAG: hypothetical protein ACRC2R_09145 [Xenococcaceae cyanobacterium]